MVTNYTSSPICFSPSRVNYDVIPPPPHRPHPPVWRCSGGGAYSSYRHDLPGGGATEGRDLPLPGQGHIQV